MILRPRNITRFLVQVLNLKNVPTKNSSSWNFVSKTFEAPGKDSLSTSPLIVLGISAYFHDSSATFVIDGKIVWAAQEERFDRIKNSSAFPHNAIKRGLNYLAINPASVTQIVYFEDPKKKLLRIKRQIFKAGIVDGLEILRKNFMRILSIHVFLENRLKRDLKTCGFTKTQIKAIAFSEHHLSHAASAFLPSPFEEACVLVADAVGELDTISIWKANRSKFKLLASMHFPNSLGMFYSAFTHYCGFKVNSGEYKLMGLAPFGEPRFTETLRSNIIIANSDASFEINSEYLTYETKLGIVSHSKLEELLGFPARVPESPITKNYMDLAASVQEVLNQMMLSIAGFAQRLSGNENLCMAGGVALNCVTNEIISCSGHFQRVWIQPASGDAGTSLGAALLRSSWTSSRTGAYLQGLEDSMFGSFLGSEYTNEDIKATLEAMGIDFQELSKEQMIETFCESIVNNRVIGLFQGRMEFGPRALGSRSIVANPTDPFGQSRINLKIKFRESFRPFAPAIRIENVSDYFDAPYGDKYMLRTAKIRSPYRYSVRRTFDLDEVKKMRSNFPSVTHVDFSARVQTVDIFSPLYELLKRLEDFGIPMLVNTSFNVRGEPIVESPTNAINCFLATGIDDLFIGSFYVRKELQSKKQISYINNYKLD